MAKGIAPDLPDPVEYFGDVPKHGPPTDAAIETIEDNLGRPTNTIARMAFCRDPEVFKSIGNACRMLRYVLGTSGEKNRKNTGATFDDLRRRHAEAKTIPESAEPPSVPFILPEGIDRWLGLFDVHIPFHNKPAVEKAVAHGKKMGCDGVILGGDFADCYQLSWWQRDPRHRRFPQEIEDVNRGLNFIEDQLNPKLIVWKCGNHEDRLERYLMSRAPDLWGIPEFTFESFLHLKDRGIQWVEAHIPIQYKALNIIHGTEYKGGVNSPVNPARGVSLKAKECTLVGHHHRTSEHTGTTIRRTTVTCWSVGCLCNLSPRFMPLNEWNHGFAVLHTGSEWHIENRRIIAGNIV